MGSGNVGQRAWRRAALGAVIALVVAGCATPPAAPPPAPAPVAPVAPAPAAAAPAPISSATTSPPCAAAAWRAKLRLGSAEARSAPPSNSQNARMLPMA